MTRTIEGDETNTVGRAQHLALVSNRVSQALAAGTPNAFSQDAAARVAQLGARHTEELALLAIEIAAANSLDVVSASDVEEASRSLIPRGRSTKRAMEVVGGLVGGAGLSEFATAVTAPHPSTLAFSFAAMALVTGATMLTAALTPRR